LSASYTYLDQPDLVNGVQRVIAFDTITLTGMIPETVREDLRFTLLHSSIIVPSLL
jgi:hypothetical protein